MAVGLARQGKARPAAVAASRLRAAIPLAESGSAGLLRPVRATRPTAITAVRRRSAQLHALACVRVRVSVRGKWWAFGGAPAGDRPLASLVLLGVEGSRQPVDRLPLPPSPSRHCLISTTQRTFGLGLRRDEAEVSGARIASETAI